jgi:hypothetical protein
VKWTLILGFANAETANRSLQLFETTRKSDSKVLILDNHYPESLKPPDWKAWAKRLGGEYLDAGRNLGLHNGLNWMLSQVGATRSDAVIGFDPDTCPLTDAWDTALFSALQLPGVGWASLGNRHSESEMEARGYKESTEIGFKLWTTNQAVMNSICAFNLDWVLDCGGFQEPTEFYGGLECAMWKHLTTRGKRWVWLKDYREGKFEPDLQDAIYKAYKWEHAHKGWKGSFDDFLLQRQQSGIL